MSVAPVDSSFYEKLLANTESEIEGMLQIRSNFLHPTLRPDYLKTIQSLANDILSKMSEMMRQGIPRDEIYQLQKDSFHRLKSVEDFFTQQNAILEGMTTAQRATFRSNEEKVRGTTFVSPPDRVKNQMRDDLLIGMGIVSAAGAAINAADQGLQVFNESLRLACAVNPLMPSPLSMPLCLPVVAEAALGQAISELSFVQHVQKEYNNAIQKAAVFYENELGIPKPVTTQFGDDLPNVASMVALAGATRGVPRMMKFLKADAGSVKIPSFVTAEKVKILTKPWAHEKPLQMSAARKAQDISDIATGIGKKYTPEELAQKKLVIRNGLVHQGNTGELLHSSSNINIVLRKDGTLLADKKVQADGSWAYHSALCEEPIAAGNAKFHHGRVSYLDEGSGHFLPFDRLQYIEFELKAQGALFTEDFYKLMAHQMQRM